MPSFLARSRPAWPNEKRRNENDTGVPASQSAKCRKTGESDVRYTRNSIGTRIVHVFVRALPFFGIVSSTIVRVTPRRFTFSSGRMFFSFLSPCNLSLNSRGRISPRRERFQIEEKDKQNR